MGAGLPVVVFPTDAEKRVIQDGRTGFFADTPEAFKVIMERLITNPDLRSAVGAAAHAEVWSKYSLSRQVAQISQALIEIRAKRKLRSVS
jgi:glycosyltransferase involved in cell wall biosynthesis